MLIFRHNAMMAGSSKRLPYDAEVEWIESTGLEWINTGVVPPRSGRLSFDLYCFASTRGNRHSFYFGAEANSAWPHRVFLVWDKDDSNGYLIAGNGHIVHNMFRPPSSVRQTAFLISESLSFEQPLYIFNCCRGDGTVTAANAGRARFFSLSLTDGTNTLLDLVPVRKGDEGCLYDKVSERLLRNVSNAGAFIVGPDI